MDITGKKIVVTCGGGIGDLIMFTPALKMLKEKYGCSITFITPKNPEILKGLPYIDEIVHAKRGVFLGRFRHLHKMIGKDAVVFSDWQPYLLLFSGIINIPVIAGFVREGHWLSSKINKPLTHRVMDSTNYVAETTSKFIQEALSIEFCEELPKCEVAIPSDEDVKSVKNMLSKIGISNNEFIVLSPFTGFELRNWSVNEAKLLVDMIEEKYDIPVVVLGTPERINDAVKISKYNLVGRTTVMELVELIRRAKLLITPDSGPMHIAGAVGTSVVALFSKDLPSRWAPKRNCWPITLSLECSPCDDDTARRCKHNVACMNGITAEMVFEKIRQILM